jgi:hypothetical protein
MTAPRLYCYVCPNCDTWQLEYEIEDLLTYATFTVDEKNQLIPNLRAMDAHVEWILYEHYEETHPEAWAEFQKSLA